MFRRLTLAVFGCTVAMAAIASSASAALPSTDPNTTFCKNTDGTFKAKGIYNDAKVKGKFDLTPTSTKVNAIVGFTGGANLCGTKPTSNQFYTDSTGAKITYYSGAVVRCARPNPTTSACGNPISNVGDGSYTGNSSSKTYCMGTSGLCQNATGMVTLTSRTRVRYNTAGPGTDANRCVSPASPALLIACESSEVDIVGIKCSSDIIITKASATGQYKMTIYAPTCTSSLNLNPVYFLNIYSLTICKGYGTASGTFGASGTCRDTSTSYWLAKNGPTTGAKTYNASATMTGGGGTQTATASVTLTP